jgi:hypothetical protein
MLAYILIAVWGALTFLLFSAVIYYSNRVRGAERKRDEATTLAAEAVQARQKTLEAYDKEVEKFKAHMALPLVANMTDEQVEHLGNLLAGKLLQANTAVNLTRVQ